MLKLILTITLVFLSNAVSANAVEAGKINRFMMESNSIISVWLDGTDDITDCAGGARWSLHTDDTLYNAKLSLLLTAYTTDKVVKLFHTPGWTCGGPLGNANRIYSIDVQG
jgi:hypothetical protein